MSPASRCARSGPIARSVPPASRMRRPRTPRPGASARLSIARALYKNSDIIIFDEATSALDALTEEEVFESLRSISKNKTIIFITHRSTSLESADAVYRVENNGELIQVR